MKRTQIILILTVLLAATAIVSTVSAQNMTITHLGLGVTQDVMIYDSTGVLYAVYNTSSAYVPLPSSDFTMVIKPTEASRAFNPVTLFYDIIDLLIVNWPYLFVILGCLAILFGLAKEGER